MDLHIEVKSCDQIGASRRGGETSGRGEVLWPVGLHVEVRCCGLDEQVDLLVRRY